MCGQLYLESDPFYFYYWYPVQRRVCIYGCVCVSSILPSYFFDIDEGRRLSHATDFLASNSKEQKSLPTGSYRQTVGLQCFSGHRLLGRKPLTVKKKKKNSDKTLFLLFSTRKNKEKKSNCTTHLFRECIINSLHWPLWHCSCLFSISGGGYPTLTSVSGRMGSEKPLCTVLDIEGYGQWLKGMWQQACDLSVRCENIMLHSLSILHP